jgi:hypothetical protein
MYRMIAGLLCLLLLAGVAAGADVELKAVKFYALIEADGVAHLGGKTINVKTGDSLEFHEYAPHSGLAPDLIDIGIVLKNQGVQAQNTEVRVAVSPKVGKVVLHQDTPDLPIHEATEASAEWLAPIVLLKQRVKNLPSGREIQITFRKIALGPILKDYMSRKLWPVTLNFEATVEPSAAEETFKNNTLKRTLKIKMWE